jgi:hypothetical protein
MPDHIRVEVAVDGASWHPAAWVVPLLQEWGSLRSEHPGTTFRDNLGLPPLSRRSAPRVAAAEE